MNADLSRYFDLSGAKAVITGGARGIGFQIALTLAQAGAEVCILDRDGDPAFDAARRLVEVGHKAVALTCDVGDADQIKATFADIKQRFGELDILVNNAARVHRVPAVDTAVEDWKHVMDVNLTAPFLCSCEAVKLFDAERGGAIVNLASIMGLSGGGIYPIASYHATKGGLVNLTKALAVEWAPKNVRVNAIAPTWVRTEFTKALLDDPERAEILRALMPLRRFAEIEDVALAALYLVAPASRMVTGHTLPVDGGYLAR